MNLDLLFTFSCSGVHQQDLVSLSEANKDHMIDGRVHWKKFLLMGESIQEMMRFQPSNYRTLEPNIDVLYFIGHESILTEDASIGKKSKIRHVK